VTTLAE